MENMELCYGSSETRDISDANLEEVNLYYQTKANKTWNKLPLRATPLRNGNIIIINK